MSVNQSRGERTDSAPYKRLGRSGSSGQQWNPSGGKGGGGTAHPPSSVNPSYSTNRSFKNPNNAQRMQPRVGTGGVSSSPRPLQNEAHPVPTQQGTPVVPIGGVAIKSAAEVPAQRNAGVVTNAQSSQPAARNSEATAPPTTPAKASGDTSKSYPLQFGTISPGFVNGMQIPARTSSAPPNLDEQKHDQARHAAVRPVMTHPVPSVPKPQTPRKVGVAVNQTTNDDSHQIPKARRETQVSAAPHMPQVQKSPVHSMPGVPMPLTYHQAQVAVQFGRPSPLIQSQAAMSMQMPMALPMGNPAQLPQQMFLQPHPMPHQGLMHQNQSLNFTPQMNTQLAPQLGSLGIGIGAQFTQQSAGKVVSRKPVKITHPETHEELKLNDSLGSKSHSSAPQTLPSSATPTHTVNYYTAPYTSNPLYPAPGSISMNNTQIAPSSQPPRFVYPVNQGPQSVPFTNPSYTPHSNKNNNQLHGISEPSAAHHVTVRPASVIHAVKVDSPAAIGSTTTDKVGSHKVSQQAGEVNSFHSQREPVAHTAPITSSLPATVNQPKGISSLPIQETKLDVTNNEVRCAEVVDRSEPLKNLQNENSKGRQSPTHQVSTQSTSISDFSSNSLHQSGSVANGPIVAIDGEKVNASNGTSENFKSYNELFPRLGGSSDSSCMKKLNDSVAIDSLASGNNASKENFTEQAEPQKLENIDNKEQPAGVKEESKQTINDSDLSLDSVSPKSSEVASQSESHNSMKIDEFEKVDKSSAELVDATISVDLAPVSESSLNSEGDGSSTASSPKEERPVAELSRTKSIVSKGRKKRMEILRKADAVGASSDLYNAYKAVTTLKHTKGLENTPSDLKQVEADVPQNDIISSEKGVQSKTEPDDWEDAADISTPKLVEEVKLVDKKDSNGLSSKKYSRDFLLTLSEHNTDLPYGLDVSDIGGELFMGSNANMYRDPYPSGRNMGRGGHRSGGAPVRDSRQDNYANNYANARSGQGGNHGVLRNPRSPAGPYGGGMLNGPMMQPTISLQRNNSESERWQRSSSQKGLIPSPQTPMQVMHKAEKKYEVGVVTDEEQIKQRQLKAILNKLTPQNFEKLFQQVKDVNIDNANTLAGVISQIFDKALTEPTFCHMYADFCFHLSRELPDFSEDNEKITFKRLLLSKCQEEFERGEREQEEANKADEEGEDKQSKEEREEKRLKARRRMLGNIRLIGELYKQKMLTEKIMHECIKKLFGRYQTDIPDEEDIEALCKLMSTIGEMIDHQKAKVHMDAYFNRMADLSVNMNLSSRVRFMLKDSIDLRRNKWQQRRKVEGPKKIEEVHRDAAQERQVQASRMTRGNRPMDFSPRPTPMVGGFRSTQQQQQQRGYINQDFRTEERNQYENRTTTLPLPQRPVGDSPITLGPQGGLARGMSIRGQNNISTESSRRLGVVPNGSDRPSSASREDLNNQTASDRSPYEQPNMAYKNIKNGSRDLGSADSTPIISSPVGLSEERLQAMSKSTIKEFYSAEDMKEVLQCVKDLNSPSFYPCMISLWVMDAFERKDAERALLSKLLVNLSISQGGILSRDDFIKGFELTLSSLEDAVNDAPKAAEFLGCIFAKIILDNVVSFTEIGQLIFDGGEEPGSLVETGLAAEVVGTVMETISSTEGESVLKEIRTGSSLKVEQFRHSDPKKSRRLDNFI